MTEVNKIEQHQVDAAIAAYKDVRQMIGRFGIRDLLELMAQISEDFGEGKSSIPRCDGEEVSYGPDATWLAIAVAVRRCSDGVNAILREGDRP